LPLKHSVNTVHKLLRREHTTGVGAGEGVVTSATFFAFAFARLNWFFDLILPTETPFVAGASATVVAIEVVD
jgi:hypothetical protein